MIALALAFGSVPNQPALAALSGTVTAELLKGQKASGTVLWTMGSTERFRGAPLSSLTFHLYSLAVTRQQPPTTGLAGVR